MVKIEKTKEMLRKLPQQKPHIEFISALLTIPVLITVIMLNLNNLRAKPAVPAPTITGTPSPASPISQTPKNQTQFPVSVLTTTQISITPQPTTNPDQCIKDIGPIDIISPQEGQTLTANPLCIEINYTPGNYCSVVWAYKINNGPLSDYSNNSVCYNNLPNGVNTFILQVKSLISSVNKTIVRKFNVQTGQSSSLTPTAAASSSATTQ